MRISKIVAGLAMSAFVFGSVSEASAEPVKLKAAIYTGNASSPFRTTFDAFVEHLNKSGEVSVESVVGPEAVPSNQQARALADGLVDIVAAPPSYFENLLPGLGGLSAPRITTQEMRAKGAFEATNELLAPVNIKMVGLYAGDIPFYIFSNKPARTLAEFKGLRLRTTNTVKAFFEALEAQPLQIKRGEIYTALERGVANGYANINSELFTSSWIEVAKYRLGPGFYTPNIAIFMNLEKYNSLSDAQKAALDESGVYVEGAPTAAMKAAEDAAIDKAVKENGFEVIELSDAETKKFLDMAYNSTWAEIEARAPEFSAKLKPILLAE